MAELNLTVFLHPSMQIPFKFDDAENKFTIKADAAIVDLMDECEMCFEKVAEKSGHSLELQINVLWNIKDHKKALNPQEKVGKHFADGEVFGVYGDVQPRSSNDTIPEDQKCPVTILTGFLGAGKTTMLNYILREQKDKKIAIIENEFGEVSIDDDLLRTGEGPGKTELAEKIIVMDNGCMCCTIRGDLVAGLQAMIDEIKKGVKLDAIIIETTGMADPVPIVRTFMSSPELTADLRLDGVLTVADGKNLLARLAEEPEEGKANTAYQQVAFADKICLNKVDLISSEEAIKVKDAVREINKYAKVLSAVKGQIKMSEIGNMHAHNMSSFTTGTFAEEAEAIVVGHADSESHGGGHEEGGHNEGHGDGHSAPTEGHGGGHGGYGGHGGSAGHGPASGHGGGHGALDGAGNLPARYDSRVNSFAIVKEGEIIPRKLSQWMQSLGSLPADRGTIYRIKAILAVKDHPFKHVFHAVMDISDEDDAGPWGPDEKRISKIIFIGKSLDQKFLRDGFEAIFDIKDGETK